MNLKSVAAAFALLTTISFSALAQPVMLSHSQARQLMRMAHTPQQYQELASYFHAQQKIFSSKTEAEKQEWHRRSAITSGPELKPPAAADSARNLYQYYAAKADDMAMLAASYDQRAK